MNSPNLTSHSVGYHNSIAKFLTYFFVFSLSFSVCSQTKAFPEIQGAGSYVTGGRGGIVVKVTNLNNSGSGSLRSALLMTVPRIIVFEVSGTIVLQSSIELILENSNFTIAGQTAPEGGITISNNYLRIGGGYYRPSQPCNNIIIRHIRFRNGGYTGVPDVAEHNGVISTGCEGLVFDHCSFSFCDDQALAVGGNYGVFENVTIQRSIFSENATQIIAGHDSTHNTGKITVIENAFIDTRQRTPNMGGNDQYDVINNYYFNWMGRLSNINDGSPEVNYIGNYMKEGSYTTTGSGNKYQAGNTSIYTANNYHSSLYTTPQLDDRDIWQDFFSGNAVSNSRFTTTMHPLLNDVIPYTALNVPDILNDIGANRYLNPDGTFGVYSDSFDVTKIYNAQNNISSDPDNKNWTMPTLPLNTRPDSYDTDNDGMSDVWENDIFGTLSKTASADEDGDGYTNIEEFINGTETGSVIAYQVNAGDDVSICENSGTTLTATDAESYLWTPGNHSSASIDINPTATTTYTVTGTHDDGSTTTDTVTVTVNPLPTANAGNDVEICQGASVTLTASGGTSYQWNTGQTSQSITVNPNNTTTYSVEVTQNSCQSEPDQVTVTVNELPNTDAGQDITINFGDSTLLTASGADSYLWNTGESTQSITVSPTVETTYSVTGATNTCESTDSVTVFLQGNAVVANAGEDTEICSGSTTTLTASGGAAYVWSTGETTANIDVSPTLTTTYTVTVYDETGTNSDTDEVIVNVIPLPTANAGDDVEICESTSVTLTASGGSNYLWNTGQTTESITVNPEITTTYSVEVSNNNCSNTDDVTVTVNTLPIVDAGADISITEGESITLTAIGADTYLWNTGETTASIVVSPDSTATYSVTGYTNGCEAADEVVVTVEVEAVTANAGEDVTICEGESVILTASGGTTYLWSTAETTASIEVAPNTTATYSVTAYNATGTSEDSDDVTVTVNPLPTIDAGADVSIMLGDTTTLTASGADTYLWSTGETTASIDVTPLGSTIYSVTGFTNGCEASDSLQVITETEDVIASAGEDVTICEGESVTLTASGGTTYLWSTGETTGSIEVAPNSTSTYTVTAYNSAGTSEHSDDVTVTVNPLPTVDAGADITITEGDSTTLTAIGADTYLWNTGETTATINVSPDSTTTYSATGFTNGCEASDEVVVTVESEAVTANAGEDVTICAGESVTLTASGGTTYLWSTGETIASIEVAPSITTIYTVTAYSSAGTNEDSDDVSVTVNPLPTLDAGADISITEGESTTLTATGADTYLWDTGETTATITVSPDSTTAYSVTGFTNGCEASDDVVVTVETEAVTANAGADVTICEGESAILTVSGGATYLWSTGETTASIEVTPNTTTTYSVTAYNSTGTSEASADVTVTVNSLPIVDAGADVSIQLGDTTTLTASGADTYLWSTGETTASIDVTPTGSTIYTVTGFANECEASDSIQVTTETEDVIADAGADITICEGESVTLTASGGTTYLWSTGETLASIEVAPNGTTTYTVTAYNSAGTGEDSDDVIVTVNPLPTVDAGTDVTIALGDTTTLTASGAETYLWNTGATTASIDVTPTGSTIYTVTGFTNDCEASDSVLVTTEVEDVIANAGEDITICNGESATLTASGGTTYLWSTGETSASIEVVPNNTTTYIVTVYNSAGTSEDSDDITVSVNPLPTVDAGADITIALGDTTTLTATGADTYLWNTGATTASIDVTPTGSTIYSVIGFTNGCEASDSVQVTTETEAVIANAGADVTICEGESVILTASGGTTYLWNTGETSASIEVTPNTTSTYTVIAYNSTQTASDEDSIIVTVNEIPNINAGEDVIIFLGENTILTATGAESYLWSTGETTASIVVSPETSTTYTVTGFSESCGEFTDQVLVSVAYIVSAGANQTICQGYETTLTASEGDAYLWNTGETTQSITVNPANTQTYTVIVFIGDFQDDADVTVSVNPNPNVVITNGSDVTILEGEFVTLSATGANTYLWNNGATQPNIAVSPSVTTTYEVTGFINNCEDTTALVVNVVETVQADAGEDIVMCAEETVTLTANGGDEYLWNTGETTQSIEVAPNSDTEYSVLVYNALSSDEDTVMVYVTDCSSVETPEDAEAFDFLAYQEPIADVLKIKISGMQNVNVNGIAIYDMAGKMIYTEHFNDTDQQSLEKEISTSQYSRGVYIVRLTYDDTSILKKIPIR